jgi:DNA replication licensing factor MCM2
MIRIAEAHARIHLRDFVNDDDDINVAIQIVLQRFIDAQKYGIKRTMQKVWTNITERGCEDRHRGSCLGLSSLLDRSKGQQRVLLFLLKQLFQEKVAFQRNGYGADRLASSTGTTIKISEEDHLLVEEALQHGCSSILYYARQYNVLDLKQFYESPLIRSHGFQYEDNFIAQVLEIIPNRLTLMQ